MLSGSVAAAHQEMTAHHAALAAHAAAASPFDFSQLVDGAQSAAGTAGTGNTPSTNATEIAALKAKHRHDIAEAADAAAGQIPQPTPPQSLAQPLAATAAAAPSSSAQALANGASAAAAAVAAATHPAPPTPSAAGTSAPDAAGNASDQNGQTAPLPLGAADLEARVAIGAQNYLSQPSAALGGLWHHGGEPGAATPQSQSGANQDDAAAAGDAENSAPGQAGLAAKTIAALAPAAAAASNAALAGDSVAAAKPDAAAAAALPDAAAAAAQNFTLPGTSDAQAAATTPGANAALPTAAHILPAYEQVAINLKQAAQSGTDRIEIQLKPASLGAIAVKLDVTHDGRITAVISADRSDTLHMLRQDSAGLQQALRDAGLQADSGSLSFNLRGDAQSFAQNSQNSAPAQTGSSPAGPALSAGSDTPAARPRRHDGALDIEV